MHCLTLTQPWATLVVLGAKRLETRSWSTTHRGPLAIHAAKLFPAPAQALCLQEPVRRLLAQAGYLDWHSLPLGQLLGTVELTGCTRVEELADVPALEGLLGDFSPGRWAWTLTKPTPLPAPVPCRGRLGLFKVPDVLLAGGVLPQ